MLEKCTGVVPSALHLSGEGSSTAAEAEEIVLQVKSVGLTRGERVEIQSFSRPEMKRSMKKKTTLLRA